MWPTCSELDIRAKYFINFANYPRNGPNLWSLVVPVPAQWCPSTTGNEQRRDGTSTSFLVPRSHQGIAALRLLLSQVLYHQISGSNVPSASVMKIAKQITPSPLLL